jgi:hypothetical protein
VGQRVVLHKLLGMGGPRAAAAHVDIEIWLALLMDGRVQVKPPPADLHQRPVLAPSAANRGPLLAYCIQEAQYEPRYLV